jgi:hypothetical protein
MASTYVNDLRLNEMATGDGSGTWGTTTNTNLELIAEAFSYGTEAITTNADTHTTTIADGATDPGRALYLKYTGTLDSACTITIGPNTVSKVWIIENGTSGSQDIIISQGSGANITIPAGDTKVVYSDGAGAGAAFFDAFASLSVVDLKVQDDLTVTDDASIGGDATITGTLGVTGAATFSSSININSASYDNRQAGVDSGGFYIYNVADSRYDLQISDIGGLSTSPAAGGNAIFNEGGVDADFRVESDGNAYMLFVDGGNDAVGIGTNVAGNSTLEVRSTGVDGTFANAIGFQYSGNSDEANTISTSVSSTAGSSGFKFNCSDGGGSSGKTSVLKITRADMVVNDDSNDIDFRVESDANTHALFVDASVGTVLFGGTSAFSYDQTSGNGVFGYALDNGSDYGSLMVSNNADRGWSMVYANKFAYTSGDDRRYIAWYVNGGALANLQLNAAGTQVEYNTGSDRRLKENIVDIDDGIVRLKQMQPRKYTWVGTDFPAEGFIADEADGIVPEAVKGEVGAVDDEGNPIYQQIEYSRYVPLLTAALKEAVAKIEALEARITALES